MFTLPPIKGQTKKLCKCDGCGETKYTLEIEANPTMEVNKLTLCDTCRLEFYDWLRYWS